MAQILPIRFQEHLQVSRPQKSPKMSFQLLVFAKLLSCAGPHKHGTRRIWMESEIRLQCGAQYSYRPSFLLPGRWWLVKIDQSDRIRLQCGPVRLDTLLSFPVCAFANCHVLTLLFSFLCCRQLNCRLIGWNRDLNGTQALWQPCCCHVFGSNIFPRWNLTAGQSVNPVL